MAIVSVIVAVVAVLVLVVVDIDVDFSAYNIFLVVCSVNLILFTFIMVLSIRLSCVLCLVFDDHCTIAFI